MNGLARLEVPASRILAGLSLACWICAWFLPLFDGYSGLTALRAWLQGPLPFPIPSRGEDAIAQMLSTQTNVAFVVMWLLWLRGKNTRPALYTKVALACLLLNLYWLVEFRRAGAGSELLSGYYAWLAAFVLLVALGVVSVVSARRTSRTPTAGTPA